MSVVNDDSRPRSDDRPDAAKHATHHRHSRRALYDHAGRQPFPGDRSRASVRGHDRSASWRTGEDQRLTGVTPIGRCSTPRVSTTPPQRRSSRETSAPCERGNVNGHSISRVLVLASPGSAFATLAVVVRVNRPNLRPLAPALQETADAAEGWVGAGGCARL